MKKTKTIKIDVNKCTGCRACQSICTASHAEPKYSIVNPKRSRIHIFRDEDNDLYIPVFAGPYTQAECDKRDVYIIGGKEYDECTFCPASCPSRDLFKEPDSGLPLKCDACLQEPPLEEPLCVTWCLREALTYVEGEEKEEKEQPTVGEKEEAVEYLVKKYGLDTVKELIDRMAKG